MKLAIPHTIVTYHEFGNVSNFEKQLQLLSRQKKVLLTTDDGDLSFYTTAYPLILKYKIQTILFIIPSLIGTNDPFWWNEVYYYLGKTAGSQKIKTLKSIPNSERVAYLESLRTSGDKPLLRQTQLTVAQLQEMQNNGIIIANHSFTHPMFDQCSEDEIREELRRTKVFFEQNQLDGYSLFAYPNGNYNELTEKVLQEEGITQAFLFDHKINKGKINPLRISRLSVNHDTPIWKFKLILSGWHSKIVPLTKTLHHLLRK
ncbi:polysaccharide deacetylase family protein [Flavobacterium sp. IMCC34852]|uniref:Polysaccharide deacetylase family protein n=1 Tax=Flavobacterium rivulicola TaxID=2732161 RepID=A0A7Y3R9R4_9FLAO|nr:polysaccharide deacetylase family protein [Flavobacterium sp. IMCC34852]NNT72554.1 polysaccharide deacetylase family protein [Flavobacterium sp. IMCC34852]